MEYVLSAQYLGRLPKTMKISDRIDVTKIEKARHP
jgi:hypothetical protein